MNYRDGAFAIRVKDEARVWIEGGRVHMIADRQRCNDLTAVRIDYSHYVASAPNEKPSVRLVHGHARRRFAGRCGPALLNCHLPGVDLQDQILVFQIVKNVSPTICDREFRTAA